MPNSTQAARIANLRALIAQTNEGKNPAGQRALTDDLRVKGGLFFGGTRALVDLPDNLTVAGDLNLRATGLLELPEHLRVFGSLNLSDSPIKHIPSSLRVYGNLDIRKTAVKTVDAAVCFGQIIRTQAEFDNASNKLNLDAFAELTGMGPPPGMLCKLIAFQDAQGFETYCNGFGIYGQTPDVFRNWTTSDALAGRLFCIGQANASGSLYAIWNADDTKPLDSQPVIAFGDEGGVWVVATDLAAFFKLLSFDSEPTITRAHISFHRREVESLHHKKLATFLKTQFGITKITKADDVEAQLRHAAETYQHRLNSML
jgi:hypothetical protein